MEQKRSITPQGMNFIYLEAEVDNSDDDDSLIYLDDDNNSSIDDA